MPLYTHTYRHKIRHRHAQNCAHASSYALVHALALTCALAQVFQATSNALRTKYKTFERHDRWASDSNEIWESRQHLEPHVQWHLEVLMQRCDAHACHVRRLCFWCKAEWPVSSFALLLLPLFFFQLCLPCYPYSVFNFLLLICYPYSEVDAHCLKIVMKSPLPWRRCPCVWICSPACICYESMKVWNWCPAVILTNRCYKLNIAFGCFCDTESALNEQTVFASLKQILLACLETK